MIPAVDISKYQGAWQDYSADIIMIRMSSGGTGALAYDPDATQNYNDAKAANKAVGGYHYIGWIGAAAEATYFLQAMSPLTENDVYALDVEDIPAGTDPVSYVQTMVNLIHDKINVWPLIYMNLSTLNAYSWDSILQDCGLWLADWNNDPNGTISTVHTYVMQQYSDGPVYDHDEWFGTIEAFNAYGYHATVTAVPSPAQPPTEIATPVETPPSTDSSGQGSEQNTNTPADPETPSTPVVTPEPTPVIPSTPQPKPEVKLLIVQKILNLLKSLLHKLGI